MEPQLQRNYVMLTQPNKKSTRQHHSSINNEMYALQAIFTKIFIEVLEIH